jgi:BirA family biotin operon repressor/biotin-[acetyl-CoA-carboxylase] ligase
MTVTAYRIEAKTTTTSTMDDVRLAAQNGAEAGLVMMAAEQTGGRGRRGRSWFSPIGNLYVSVLLRPDGVQADLGLYSFMAALALAQSLPESLAAERVQLKWPNDVLVDGAKIAGILLESCPTPQGLALMVGVGVNIAHAPTDAPYATTSLAQLGYDMQNHPPRSVLDRFLTKLSAQCATLQKEGFSPIRTAWLSQAAGIGSMITVRLPDNELNGRFIGLDEKGCLLLQPATGILQKIASGEVFAPLMKAR